MMSLYRYADENVSNVMGEQREEKMWVKWRKKRKGDEREKKKMMRGNERKRRRKRERSSQHSHKAGAISSLSFSLGRCNPASSILAAS
jgi:hypothetical protein